MCRFLSLLLCSVSSAVLFAAPSPDPLFQSADLLDITLVAPFDQIDCDRDKEREYEGSLSYTDANGQEVVLDITLEVRGNDRLKKANCRYSQLWVDFKRRQTAGTLFENQNRLKMVVQCGRRVSYANYIVKELQAYKLFAEISEINFDTRLLNVTYINSGRGNAGRTHLGFFLEHQNRLASRFDMEEVEINRVSSAELNPRQSALLALFMYLIANTDYAVTRGSGGGECCHNAKLLQDRDRQYFPIPYDFDSSGFVNTNYAVPPDPALRISRNTRRLYRGFCVPPETLDAAIRVVQASRDRIVSIVGDTSHVDQRVANRSVRFVEDFFEIIDDPRRTERLIIRACRG
jgi:hypothetical protein